MSPINKQNLKNLNKILRILTLKMHGYDYMCRIVDFNTFIQVRNIPKEMKV